MHRGGKGHQPLRGFGLRPAGLDREDHRNHQQPEVCQLADWSAAAAAGFHHILHYREAHQVCPERDVFTLHFLINLVLV